MGSEEMNSEIRIFRHFFPVRRRELRFDVQRILSAVYRTIRIIRPRGEEERT